MLKLNKTKLKNGLEVYHIPLNRGSKVISVDIFYKVGSRNETMGKSGIAHMLEHLNFKSTKNLKAGEFDEIVKGFGGVNNASTGFDYTHYFIKCTNTNLDKALWLYADLMQNLRLKNSEFLPERDVVAEERRWRTDNNPLGYLYFRLYNHAFIYHPYHWTPIGFSRDIATWSIDDIKDFHEKFYQPNNAILIVSGDINKKDVFELAKKHFGLIKNKHKQIPKPHCIEPAQDGARTAILERKSEVDMLALAFKTPPFNHPDQPAINALSEYLSNGKSSLLWQELVEKTQMANQIYAYNMDSIDENLFIFLVVCNPGVSAESARKKLNELIKQIKDEKIDDENLERVKNLIKSDFIYSFDSASKVANLYGSYLARGDIEPLYSLKESIENIDAKMLQDVAKKYFLDKNSTCILLKGGTNGKFKDN